MSRYEDLSDGQKVAGWDKHHGLSDRKWLLYRCSDCDPEFAEDDEDERTQYTGPMRMVYPAEEDKPDYCPRCGSYLSLDEGTEVYVTTRKLHAS
jgi:DNA-directed RNA polymerase subunit RPC12/RpoP